MIKVGITGGIGSGKTLVCQVFEKLGVPVFYADREAKKLQNEDPDVKKAMIEYFGAEIYDSTGLKKAVLASKIFNNPVALQKVNKIVHPAVRNLFTKWVKERQDSYDYVIEEAAILFETGLDKELDFNILVYAPEKLRIKRVTERDQAKEQEVKERMQHQMKDEEKINRADAVVYNDGSQMVLPQILEIHNRLIKK
jgi:dephospho-CoA kinase